MTHNTREGIEEMTEDILHHAESFVADYSNKEWFKARVRNCINDLLHQELQKARESERERCTDMIAHHCRFAMENSKSADIRNFASSLANRLYTVINTPDEDQSELDQPIS